MNKYINADKLIAEIERQQRRLMVLSNTEQVDMRRDCALQNGVYVHILGIIDSLQQEQPEDSKGKFVFPKFLYARTADNKTIDVSYAPQSMDAIEYVRNNSAEVQLEVNFDKELKNKKDTLLWDAFGPMNGEQSLAIKNFARYFYELGRSR